MFEMFEMLKTLCPPALVYLILYTVSLLTQIMAGNSSFLSAIISVVIIFVWVWLLNYLCSKGYEMISWVFVFLPFIIVACMFIFLASVVGSLSEEDKKEISKKIKNKKV